MASYPQVILTCFAGRRKYMEIMMQYADALYRRGLIHEVHLWDYTRDQKDSEWLEDMFGHRSIAVRGYKYVDTEAVIPTDGTHVPICFKASNDAHVCLATPDGVCVCEICFGGWDNTFSVIRRDPQGVVEQSYPCAICDPLQWVQVSIQVTDSKLRVFHRGQPIFALEDMDLCESYKLCVAGWDSRRPVLFRLPTAHQPGSRSTHTPYVTLKQVRQKHTWFEYYQHYTKARYPEHVIIKCDDDIVFMDVDAFEGFIKRTVEEHQYPIRFASIVNNGVCAHLQQRWGLIPRSLSEFPYDVMCGKLWQDGKLCQYLHMYFIDHHRKWLQTCRSAQPKTHVHQLGDRISINFFAITSKYLDIFQMIGQDDEKDLSVGISNMLKQSHAIDKGFTVCHLAFFKQRDTGMDEDVVLQRYIQLAETFLS